MIKKYFLVCWKIKIIYYCANCYAFFLCHLWNDTIRKTIFTILLQSTKISL